MRRGVGLVDLKLQSDISISILRPAGGRDLRLESSGCVTYSKSISFIAIIPGVDFCEQDFVFEAVLVHIDVVMICHSYT